MMRLAAAIKAFPVLVLESNEPFQALRDLEGECREGFRGEVDVLVWDITGGVRTYQEWALANGGGGNLAGRPVSPVMTPISALHDAKRPTVMVALNYHWAFQSDYRFPVIQALQDGCRLWSGVMRRLVIICPPGIQLPPEVERYVHVYEHALPSIESLAKVVRANLEAQRGLIQQLERDGKLTKAEARQALRRLQATPDDIWAIAQMGRGLTLFEFANAVAASLVEHGEVLGSVIAEEKAKMLRSSEILELSNSGVTFADVGGLGRVKEFLLRTAGKRGARGVLFLGVPGVGKTMVALALGNELRLPTLVVSLSAAFTGAVGGTEQRVRRALRTIGAVGRCVVVLDEIEKALAGASANAYTGDSGTAKRLGGELLRWLSDPDREAYPVATCNDLGSLDPEYTRSGRWDSIFFFDLPNEEERKAIAAIYAKKYGIALDPRPDEHGWTGADIECAYRLAMVMGHPDVRVARQFVTPLYVTRREEVESLREWARGRAQWASETAGGMEATEMVRVVV